MCCRLRLRIVQVVETGSGFGLVCMLFAFRSLRPRGVSDGFGLRTAFIILFHLVLFLMSFLMIVVIMSPPSTPPSSQLPEPLSEAVLVSMDGLFKRLGLI